MNIRQTQLELEQSKPQQELRQLKREQHHLLQKELERTLSDWERMRLLEIPEELKEVQKAIEALPKIEEPRRRSSGYTLIMSSLPEDLPELPKTYILS